MPRNKLSHFDRSLREQISENLRKYADHLTQYQLSDMTGIPVSTLSGYFAMRSTPNAEAVQKIADALHINKSDIDPRFSLNVLTGSNMNVFIKRLRQVMSERDVTQADLSRMTGLRSSSISDYLSGKYIPKLDKVTLIAQALSVSPTWLLGYDFEAGCDSCDLKDILQSTSCCTYGDTLLERVRSLAKERGTNVFKLEESLGFGNGTISHWDKSSPSVEKLQSVARVLNVSIPFLLGDVLYPNSPGMYPFKENKNTAQHVNGIDWYDLLDDSFILFNGNNYLLTDDKRFLLSRIIAAILKDDGDSV
nr:MAG TPA: Repressor protein CI [Caudoviricetes sp.]